MSGVSLLLCTRNRASALERCLSRFPDGDLAAIDAELVVVDNGSDDGTQSVLSGFARRARCRVEPVFEERPGLSRARNAALARARGEILCFTDDDCRLAPDWLPGIRRAFEDPDLGWCGGRILRDDPRDARHFVLESRTPRSFDPGAFVPAGAVQGANMALRRTAYEAIGGFDPMLGAGTPFRCEDVDWCARASLAGFAGAFVPDAVVYHAHGRSSGPELELAKVENDLARGAYYAKLWRLGAKSFLRHWIRSAVLPWRAACTAREIAGARRYLRVCADRGIRPGIRQREERDA